MLRDVIMTMMKPSGPPPVSYTLWSWGDNAYGQLGLGNRTFKSSPAQIGSLTTWAIVAVGSSNGGPKDSLIAIDTSGKLWSCGYNNSGQLGLGDTNNRSSPVQVGSATNWSSVSTVGCSAAITTGGALYTWGNNNSGQLGQGNITNLSTPVQLGALTTWKQVSCGGPVGANSNFMCAIKTDGTLWSWGGNAYGQLGLGNITSVSTPVQVGALTTWKQVSCGNEGGPVFTIALKTDGTLWSMGQGGNGVLGTGSSSNVSTPVQIGSATNWSYVSSGTLHVLAIKTDGTLWGWGYNGVGELGGAVTTTISTPIQISSLTTWSIVSAGQQLSIAVKTDGTTWTFGLNSYGQLGLGDRTNRSSPTQLGSLTTWSIVSAGGYMAAGLHT